MKWRPRCLEASEGSLLMFRSPAAAAWRTRRGRADGTCPSRPHSWQPAANIHTCHWQTALGHRIYNLTRYKSNYHQLMKNVSKKHPLQTRSHQFEDYQRDGRAHCPPSEHSAERWLSEWLHQQLQGKHRSQQAGASLTAQD